jgi:hypothetical protein
MKRLPIPRDSPNHFRMGSDGWAVCYRAERHGSTPRGDDAMPHVEQMGSKPACQLRNGLPFRGATER